MSNNRNQPLRKEPDPTFFQTEIFNLLVQAATSPDQFAIRMVYTRSDGLITRRYISPVYADRDRVLAQDLCDADLPQKTFAFWRISEVEIIDSNEVEIPMVEKIIGPNQNQN